MKNSKLLITMTLVVAVVVAAVVWQQRLAPPGEQVGESPAAGSSPSPQATQQPTRDSRKEAARKHKGRFRPARNPDAGLNESQVTQMDRLNTLPYLAGYKLAPEESDVTVYQPDHTYDGWNVYNSGHRAEAVIMNMDGRVVHTWHRLYEETFQDGETATHRTKLWRRIFVFPNGDIIINFDGIGLAKLDRDSNLIWKSKHEQHHDIFLTEDGTIYTLTHRPEKIPRINPREDILPDNLATMTFDGELIKEVPLYDAIEKSEFSHFLSRMKPEKDIFHTNSVFVFDGSMAHLSPVFAKGLVMVSILKLDLLAIIDMDKEVAVWALGGLDDIKWHRQHDPQLLENGNMLLFDNRGYNKKSRILEFDPLTKDVKWQYVGREGEEFYSRAAGTVMRLPNGNTLITESDNGRAFEVTPELEMVWEFLNPARAGDNDELIATVFELDRFPPDFFEWLDPAEVSDPVED